MWGALQKNAQALAAIAAEQAQKGLASANQMLEKLDGQMDGDEDEDEENEDDNYDEDGSRKGIKKETDGSDEFSMPDIDGIKIQGFTTPDADPKVDRYNDDDTRLSPAKESPTKQGQFGMSTNYSDDHAHNSIDDEIDDLLFESDAEASAENGIISGLERTVLHQADSPGAGQVHPNNSSTMLEPSFASQQTAPSQLASPKDDVNSLHLEIDRLTKLLSRNVQQSNMLASEFQTALESAIEAKSAAVMELKKERTVAENEINEVRIGAEQLRQAAELKALELQLESERENAAQLQRQVSIISSTFRDRIEQLEAAVQDSHAELEAAQMEAADCARGELEATEQLALVMQQSEQSRRDSEAAATAVTDANMKYESLEIEMQQLRSALESHDGKAEVRIQVLNEELALLRREEEHSRSNCVKLAADVNQLQSQLQALESEKRESHQISSQQDRTESEIDMLIAEKSALFGVVQRMQAEMRARDDAEAEVAEQREHSQAIAASLLKEKESQLLMSAAEVAQSAEQCASLSNELIQLRLHSEDMEHMYKESVMRFEAESAKTIESASVEECDARYHSVVLERDSLVARCTGLEDELSDMQASHEDSLALKADLPAEREILLTEREDMLKERDDEMKERGDGLKEREDGLNGREDRLIEREDELQEREDGLKEREDGLNGREDRLIEREDELQEREDGLKEREDGLNGREDRLKEREDELQEREDGLKEREDGLNGREDRLKEREDELNGREDGLKEREDGLNGREDRLKEREDEMKEREDGLKEREDILKEREDEMKEREDTLKEGEDGLKEREGHLDTVNIGAKDSSELLASLQREVAVFKAQAAGSEKSAGEPTEDISVKSFEAFDGEWSEPVALSPIASEASKQRITELEYMAAVNVDQIHSLQSTIEELESKFSVSSADVAQLTEEINASITVVLERDATVEKLQVSVSAMTAEIGVLKKSLRETGLLLDSERSCVAESEDSLFNLQAECNAAQMQVASLQHALDSAVDSKINADKVLQQSMEDAEAARTFAENLLEQSIGDDDTRAGVEMALRASMDLAEQQFKTVEAGLREALHLALEDKVRAESDLEGAFTMKSAGESMLKDCLREATEGKAAAEASLAAGLKAKAAVDEELSKCLQKLKREKELSSSSESRIEEVEAAAEREITVQLQRQNSIISNNFKARIEELEAAVRLSQEGVKAAQMESEERLRSEQAASQKLELVIRQLSAARDDLETAERSRDEAIRGAEELIKGEGSALVALRDAMEAAEQQHRAVETGLKVELQEAVDARLRAEEDLENAFIAKAETEKALRICEEDLRLTDKEATDAETRLITQNRAVADLEDRIQERVVENASLREDLKAVNARFQGLEESYLRSEQSLLDVRADLQAAVAERQNVVLANAKQMETAMEEISHYKAYSLSSETQLVEMTSQFAATEKEMKEMRGREVEYLEKLSEAQDAGKRVAEAEEALSRVEDKKKRDLENLKKQNERISSIQREMADKERAAQETISDLRGQLEASAAALDSLENIIQTLQKDLTVSYDKVRVLENTLGSDGSSILEVKIPKGDDGELSESSGEMSGSGSGSFVVIGGDSRERGRNLDLASRDPLLSAQASLVSELQDRHKDATDEIQLLKQQLAEQKVALDASHTIPEVDMAQKQQLQTPSVDLNEIAKLKHEITYITGLYERSEARAASLEEERTRLETETKELEKSLSRSIQMPSSNASVHRQRPEKSVDIELGQGQAMRWSEEEEAKKGEAGFHPIVAHVWSLVRCEERR